jgi:hypothetical protein
MAKIAETALVSYLFLDDLLPVTGCQFQVNEEFSSFKEPTGNRERETGNR